MNSHVYENQLYGLFWLFRLPRWSVSVIRASLSIVRSGRHRLISVKSRSTTICMIALLLFAATLNSLCALLIMAIAALCRMGQNRNPESLLDHKQLYLRSWWLSAMFLSAAYFGYGLYSLPVIMVIAKFSIKLTLNQTLLYSVLAGTFFICLNLMLALVAFYLGGGLVLTNKLFQSL